jgi:hypothetical protein
MKDMTTPDGIPIHHGYYRLWQRPYLPLYIEDIQTRYAVFPDIPCDAFGMLIASATKGFIACSGKDNNRYFFLLAAICQGIRNLTCGIGCKGIVITRSVNGDPGYPFKKVKQDVFVRFNFFPVYSLAHTGFLS